MPTMWAGFRIDPRSWEERQRDDMKARRTARRAERRQRRREQKENT